MKAAEKTRLKVLDTVTVSQLEQAVKTGFRHLGHKAVRQPGQHDLEDQHEQSCC